MSINTFSNPLPPRRPASNPTGLVWRGVLGSGAQGLFDPTSVVPFIEPKVAPVQAKQATLVRKGEQIKLW